MIQLNGDRVAVTGAAGFIGSHIVEELVKQNKQVIAIDNNFKQAYKSQNVEMYNEDVTKLALNTFVGVDTVFNEACSKCTVCTKDPHKDLMTNAWGTFKVCQAAVEAGAKMVHASTGSVYGESKLQHEFLQFAPKSFYGVSKLAGEQYLRAFNEYCGLRFVGLRYFHVYGPNQDSGPNGGVVAIFISKLLKGETIHIYGNGEQTRSFTYVKDVVAANLYAANSRAMDGKYYNVASGVSVALNVLLDVLGSIIGKNPKVEYHPARPGDIFDFNVSNQRLSSAGYNEWTRLQDGLKETVDWYAAQA